MLFKSNVQSIYLALAVSYFPESVAPLLDSMNALMQDQLPQLDPTVFCEESKQKNRFLDIRQKLDFTVNHIEQAKNFSTGDALTLLNALDCQKHIPVSSLLGYAMVHALMDSLAEAIVADAVYMADAEQAKEKAPRWFGVYISEALKRSVLYSEVRPAG